MTPVLDIVIPVFNEGAAIRQVLDSLKAVAYPARVLVCYDFDEDDTLTALSGYDPAPLEVLPVRNTGRGAFEAIATGLAVSTAPFVLTFPADDDYNGPRVNRLVQLGLDGHDLVSASRFMPGGSMVGCRLVKAVLVRSVSWFMRRVVGLPTHDATNGLRLFSRRVIDEIPIESRLGFAFSLELLVKVHRLGWPIAETPFLWIERRTGSSRFRILQWAPVYLRWVSYGLATTLFRRPPAAVERRPRGAEEMKEPRS